MLTTAIGLLLFWVTETSVAVVPLAAGACLLFVLGALHVTYSFYRPDPFVGPIAGGLTVVTWAGLVAGMAALAALRSNAPLVDASLARADSTLGLYTPDFVAWVAHYTWITASLNIAYLTAVPIVFATILVLGARRLETALWELCFVFAVTAPICAFLGYFTPAVAAFEYYQTPRGILDLLPVGAGRFAIPVFEAYHSRTLDVVDIRHLEGVVTFPSFHAIMALMTAFALRNVRVLSPLAWVWSCLVVVSTIPIGGHYAIDIIAGVLLWAFVTLVAHVQINRPVAQDSDVALARPSAPVDTTSIQ